MGDAAKVCWLFAGIFLFATVGGLLADSGIFVIGMFICSMIWIAAAVITQTIHEYSSDSPTEKKV